jgi:hypothetical protein
MKTQSLHDRRTNIREEEIVARRRQINSRWTPSERGRRALVAAVRRVTLWEGIGLQ